MAVLNRFPLLGLWAEEAARRQGYTKGEAESLGHAYAVLYAIRARGRPSEKEEKPPAPARKKPARAKHLRFAGDDLEVTYTADGRVRGLVGGEKPQTPASYHASVEKKFPPGYYEKLRDAFRAFFKTIRPSALQGRMVYNLYDEWKKSCGVGRLVDLDQLLEWCRERMEEGPKALSKSHRG